MHSYEYYRSLLEKHLLDYIPKEPAEVQTLFDSMSYSLTSGGKRLRPVLLLASCDFAGGDIEKALPFACAIEYIHTYSLIHDDLPAMDNDDLRRGNPTNHKVYGEAMAILAGDGLLNTAHEVMLREITRATSPEEMNCKAAASWTISHNAGISGMVAGQVADIEGETKACTEEMLRFIDANKTGALLTAPIVSGLRLAGAPEETVSDFTRYAECIGRAFQISDDILDAIGDEEIVGKKTGKDANLGKCNYVAVLGLEAAREELHHLTERAVAIAEKYENGEFFRDLARKLERRNS